MFFGAVQVNASVLFN